MLDAAASRPIVLAPMPAGSSAYDAVLRRTSIAAEKWRVATGDDLDTLRRVVELEFVGERGERTLLVETAAKPAWRDIEALAAIETLETIEALETIDAPAYQELCHLSTAA